eukprot:4741523-Pyramimonas_sp.AAC.1
MFWPPSVRSGPGIRESILLWRIDPRLPFFDPFFDHHRPLPLPFFQRPIISRGDPTLADTE